MHQTMEIYRGTDPDTFKIYSGEDIMTLSLLAHGAAGAIAAVAHVVGPEVKHMCAAMWSGRVDEARESTTASWTWSTPSSSSRTRPR